MSHLTPEKNTPFMVALRDHFAGVALPSFLPHIETLVKSDRAEVVAAFSDVATLAYEMADAMIEARKPRTI